MQKRDSVINTALMLGALFSTAVHAALLYGKSMAAPAEPMLKVGRTVVKLALIPSAAARPRHGKEGLAGDHPPKQRRSAETMRPASVKSEVFAVSEPAEAVSKEQIANPVREKGVTHEARVADGSFTIPKYPRIPYRRGIEGTAVISIEVSAEGDAEKVTVLKSSGNKHLDRAALQAAANERFIAAKRNGNPVASEFIQPVIFKLYDISP